MMEWPKRTDGSNMRMGEMTKEQRRAAITDAVRKLQVELDDPASPFRRRCEAILRGPTTTRRAQ